MSSEPLRETRPRIFIVGCSGSGKTTVARNLAVQFGVELHELDFIAWDRGGDGALLPYETRVDIARGLSEQDGWIAEGIYLRWTAPFMERADVILWLDVPLRIALWRIFWRHVRAEIHRENRFPGWRRLFRFMKIVTDQYRNRSNFYGPPDIPISPKNIENELLQYRAKVIKGTGSDVVAEVRAVVEGRLTAQS